jgi:hypothetical protein
MGKSKTNMKSRKRKLRKTLRTKRNRTRKRTLKLIKTVKNPLVTGLTVKANKLKLSNGIFGKREIINLMDYRALQLADNLNRPSDYKKNSKLFKILHNEYKRRLKILLKRKKNRTIYEKIIGTPYKRSSLERLSKDKVEKLFFTFLNSKA